MASEADPFEENSDNYQSEHFIDNTTLIIDGRLQHEIAWVALRFSGFDPRTAREIKDIIDEADTELMNVDNKNDFAIQSIFYDREGVEIRQNINTSLSQYIEMLINTNKINSDEYNMADELQSVLQNPSR